jgi:surface protein
MLVVRVEGYVPLPNGNEERVSSSGRVGSLGGEIDEWIAGDTRRATVVAKYGPVEEWNLSAVTNMAFVFESDGVFNADISKWNVAGVLNMLNLFYGKRTFNADISKWNVERVSVFTQMFVGATSFNVDISSWNVASATDIRALFYGATSFNRALCGITWIEANADLRVTQNFPRNTFYLSPGSIATTPCSCVRGRHFVTPDSPKSCDLCPAGTYQDEDGSSEPEATACEEQTRIERNSTAQTRKGGPCIGGFEL